VKRHVVNILRPTDRQNAHCKQEDWTTNHFVRRSLTNTRKTYGRQHQTNHDTTTHPLYSNPFKYSGKVFSHKICDHHHRNVLSPKCPVAELSKTHTTSTAQCAVLCNSRLKLCSKIVANLFLGFWQGINELQKHCGSNSCLTLKGKTILGEKQFKNTTRVQKTP